ncbi:MAG TPA: hypothetical protein VFQ87_14160 [Bradyrhizobium sp.]|nr:hypothetical protein [Bradyrhizobium sp.]
MMTILARAALLALLYLPSLALAQAPPGPPSAGGTPYVLFIHSGPKSSDDILVKRLAVTLAKQGYSVREPEGDQDKVGGPGVDYFADQARDKAQDVADKVNEFLAQNGAAAEPAKKLQPRKQSGKNPPNYLGVWLF